MVAQTCNLKLPWRVPLVLLLVILGGCSKSPVNTMSPEIEKLFETASDSDLCDSVFDKIWDQYNHRIVADKYRDEERVIMLVSQAKGIIDQDGFEYLFGDDFPGDPGYQLTAKAFEQIDCEQAASAFRQALSAFPGSRPPANVAKRMKIYNQVPEAEREKINRKFWKADREEAGEHRLRHQLAKYIRATRQRFRICETREQAGGRSKRPCFRGTGARPSQCQGR